MEEKEICAEFGYIGFDNAKELLLSGLEKLEYRGYDSKQELLLSMMKGLLYLRKRTYWN